MGSSIFNLKWGRPHRSQDTMKRSGVYTERTGKKSRRSVTEGNNCETGGAPQLQKSRDIGGMRKEDRGETDEINRSRY